MSIRIVFGEDHQMIRESLLELLRREPGFDVQAHADNGFDLVQLAREHQPDVVVTDISMPLLNGIEAIRRIGQAVGSCRILCLSASNQPQQVLAALNAGASGYILKENSFAELARGIRRVMTNQIVLSEDLVGAVLHASHEPETGRAAQASLLTPREREVTQLLSEGYSTQEVAARLHVSAKTVATHREHVFQKLKISSIAELTRYAVRQGLSSIDIGARPSDALLSGGRARLPA
jgi:DNA-binding NarL/FixJ family response regulator